MAETEHVNSDGSLIFDTSIDTSGLTDGLQRALQDAVEPMQTGIQDAAKEAFENLQIPNIPQSKQPEIELDVSTDEAEEKIDRFGTFISTTLGNLASQAVSKMVSTISSAVSEGIELASDLTEVQNVVDVTFGDSAGNIYSWAETISESFGMSKLAAEQYVGTLGAMLKSSGITDGLEEVSTAVVELAGDMASFYNLDVEEAFTKIRSGLSGETEPLKQLGINMSVANLEAYALAQGITTAYDSMSQAEQVMLRYEYLMSVTADAQGDFARTSDSFANQQKILELNLDNVKQALGEELLPVVQTFISTINNNMPQITELAADAAETVGNLLETMAEHKEVIEVTAAGLGTLAAAYIALKAALKIEAAVGTVTDAMAKLTTAMTTTATATELATTAASTLATTLGILGIAVVAATAAGTAIASYIDEQAELLGYEGELAESYNETTDAIVAQTNALMELYEVDKKGAYESAKSGVTDTEQSLQDVQQQLKDYRKIRDELNEEIEKLYAQNTGSSTDKAIRLKSELDDWDLKISKLSEQETYLTTQLRAQKYIIDELSGFEVAPEHEMNQSIIDEQEENAKKVMEKYGISMDGGNLEDEWSKLDHEYAMQMVQDDEWLYNQRLKLLEKYGDTSSSDYWSYYEQIADYERQHYDDAITTAQTTTEDLTDMWERLDNAYALQIVQDDEWLYNERQKLLEAYGDTSSEEYQKYYQEQADYRRKQYETELAEAEDNLDAINDLYNDQYDDLLSKQESYRSKLLSIGGDVFTVTSETDDNGNETITYTIEDIDAQLAKMQEYHNSIKQLKDEGASDALLEELISMDGDDAQRMAAYVANLDDAEKAKVFALYDEKENLADELSADLYASEAASMQEAFAAAITNLGVDSFSAGEAAGIQFASGFNGKLSELINMAAYLSYAESGTSTATPNSSVLSDQGYDSSVTVDVTVTGGKITLDGKAVGEYALDYTQKSIVQKGS